MKEMLKRTAAGAMFAALLLAGPANALAGKYEKLVQKDIEEFRAYFAEEFPEVKLEEYANGVYAIDENARMQWEEMEEFPPYELAIEDGRKLFETPFKNGKSYGEFFKDNGAVRHRYPYFDKKRGEVVTLEMAINEWREANGEKPLKYKKGDIAKLSAYMASLSRGKVVDIEVDSKEAYEAYMKGKEFFYSKRGKLNMSCAGCHMQYTGRRLRAEIISPALGHPTHFPVYRSKWGEIGTLHRRYGGCNNNIGAKPFPAQSEQYRNLEFFQMVMSNGLPFNGPGSRK